MSRAINLRLPEAEVRAECERRAILISAIEPLPGGGTHLVCMTGSEAEQVRMHFEAHIISGVVKRYPFYRGPDLR